MSNRDGWRRIWRCPRPAIFEQTGQKGTNETHNGNHNTSKGCDHRNFNLRISLLRGWAPFLIRIVGRGVGGK